MDLKHGGAAKWQAFRTASSDGWGSTLRLCLLLLCAAAATGVVTGVAAGVARLVAGDL